MIHLFSYVMPAPASTWQIRRKTKNAPLDKDGIEQCGYMGRALAALDVQVDVMISSPLKRCTQTASLVGNEIGYEGKLQLRTRLRPEATFADFRKMLEKYASQESIMVVGHNPNLSQFLGTVISDSRSRSLRGSEKGSGGASRNAPQLGNHAVVRHSENVAHALRGCGRELAAEYFAEVSRVFFDCPQFQIQLPCDGAGRGLSGPRPPRWLEPGLSRRHGCVRD